MIVTTLQMAIWCLWRMMNQRWQIVVLTTMLLTQAINADIVPQTLICNMNVWSVNGKATECRRKLTECVPEMGKANTNILLNLSTQFFHSVCIYTPVLLALTHWIQSVRPRVRQRVREC